jgi:hypothetical protein
MGNWLKELVSGELVIKLDCFKEVLWNDQQ